MRDHSALEHPGQAYVFVPALTGWVGLMRLDGNRADGLGDLFALSVDIGSEGGVMLVGAPWTSDPVSRTGMAHLYEASATFGFLESARLVQPAVPESTANYGHSVALDGTTIVVGAPGANRDECTHCGAVYIYTGLSLIFADGFESASASAWSNSAMH